MSDRLDADQVAHFALGPVGRRHLVGDAVHPRIVGRQVGEHAAEQVVLVEGEVVRHQEISREGPVVRADADHVAGIEVAKYVPADALHRRRIDEHEQTAVTGAVGPWNGGAELFPQLFEPSRAIISALLQDWLFVWFRSRRAANPAEVAFDLAVEIMGDVTMAIRLASHSRRATGQPARRGIAKFR